MTEREQKIQKLKNYFEKRDDIVMAFLFGSQAEEGRTHGHSDWDIGAYFTPTTENRVEWEEQGREYPEEHTVWDDCIRILNTDDVDLIVLNRAPASIADSAIRGIPLTMKDRGLFLDFMLIVTREAEDYRRCVNEFYEIAQRSLSLTEKDKTILVKTLYFLEQQVRLYEYFRQISANDYAEDVHKRNDVERWIENTMNALINTSKIVLGSQKRMIPETYRQFLDRAASFFKLDRDVSQKIQGWADLRNILAHEYLEIRWKRIEVFIKESEPVIRQFIDATRMFTETNAPVQK
ncbi:MAG: DUF86 domain-containing protein [Candidatus Sungbacteria bacterium]|nr:DUF86 domain-containing protein [Candidatus Sungbacteria bacterium]